MSKPLIDVVVGGDVGCGKRTLLNSFRSILNHQNTHLPIPMTVDNIEVNVVLWNPLDKDKLYDQRHHSNTDVLVLCYSIGNPDTFVNLQRKWLMDAQTFAPNKPFVLVGNKLDLRYGTNNSGTQDENIQNLLNPKKGQILAKIIGSTYVECSALTHEGVLEVFESAVRAFITHKERAESQTTLSECTSNSSSD